MVAALSKNRVSPHDLHYHEDGDVTFVVENTLFKVHRHLLVAYSTTFKEYTFPLAIDADAPEAELPVQEVLASDFADLLSVLYPDPATFPKAPEFSHEKWLRILSISARLQFVSIREYARSQLPSIPAIDKLKVALSGDASEWYVEACAELSMRPKRLTVEEGKALDKDVIIKLAWAREAIQRHLQARIEKPAGLWNCRGKNHSSKKLCEAQIFEALKAVLDPSYKTGVELEQAVPDFIAESTKDALIGRKWGLCEWCELNYSQQFQKAVDLSKVKEIVEEVMDDKELSGTKAK